MFKKLAAVALVCFSFSTLANVDAKIAPIFEEVEFKLSVEWDQKDQEFYNETVRNFETQLGELRAEGVKPADVLNYLKSNIKDQKVANELSSLVASIDLETMTLEESKSLIQDYVDGMKNTGANYHGRYGYDYGFYYLFFGGVVFYYYWYAYSYTYYDCYYDRWGYYYCY
ncbi:MULTISPECIES: hypothetical protein [Halobacteriovorax]|uniref:Uncharacterized protein n=1 Tax=Halobacteriovorax vibrionivorans TaxID=2152716 RepID=A0ABY0IJS6_9BACT|nr:MULTISPECIES: hypothetical protein [Halobacteriovorax]AYF43890.1 hypothetical protein BALOs_0880 [Halobacteriovorax sp. BALOs_7]RZF21577.1 hypothetical protein DAY19_07775 [Halobacteriovorax vibrionivorans]TGD49130.1 hypothetical protein EP118_01275 [Halobacteriovorax sp. Y22]